MIYAFLQIYIEYDILRNGITVGLSLLGCFSYYIFPFELPLAISQALVGCGLITVGHYLTYSGIGCIERLRSLSLAGAIPAGFAISALIVVNEKISSYPINVRPGHYGLIPLFWINAVGGTVLGISFCWLLAGIDCLAINMIRNRLKYVGRNPIVFVCLNQIIIAILYPKIKAALYGYIPNSTLAHLAAALLMLIIVVYAPCTFNFILEGDPLNCITGRVKSGKMVLGNLAAFATVLAGAVFISGNSFDNNRQFVRPLAGSVHTPTMDSLEADKGGIPSADGLVIPS